MSLYDVAYVTWPVLIALLVAVPVTLLVGNRRAWKDGYVHGVQDSRHDAYNDGWRDAMKQYNVPEQLPPNELTRRIAHFARSVESTEPYVSRVDPPSASY